VDNLPAGRADVRRWGVRWDNLFDDLESQLAHELSADELDIQAEEERLRLARLGLRDRLLAIHAGGGSPDDRMLRLALTDGSRACVVPSNFGRDWFSGDLASPSGRWSSCVVPIAAIAALSLSRQQVLRSLEAPTPGDGVPSAAPSALSERLGLSLVLRDLCRRRAAVEIALIGGAAGGTRVHGTIDRVGRDHLDLAVHDRTSARRERAVTEIRIVPLAQIALVRL